MKENLLILFCFIAGIGLGLSQQAPEWLHGHDLPMIILSLLILQVGISLGAGTDLRQIARSLNPACRCCRCLPLPVRCSSRP